LVIFPNCKINLGLNILQKREDGYHDLETVFYPVQLQDALEIITSPSQTNLTCSGLSIDTTDNICLKAYQLLQKDHTQIPSVHIHLHKTIPMGAGLGGGSADGAFTLLLLNKKYRLELSREQLIDYALQLGSDCPFFIVNRPCYATSRGEIMEEIDLDLSAYKLILVNPGIHVSTAWAFSKIKPMPDRPSLREMVQRPIREWKTEMNNDFEAAVFSEFPDVKQIRHEMYAKGALFASMSGSGSTVYGIFEKDTSPLFSFPSSYFIKEI